MKKPAPASHPIHQLIADRWSPRAFSERPVDHRVLMSLFEAARWAPSSFNEQPWHFIVAIRDYPEDFQLLFDCLTPGNQRWAGRAPVLMLSVAKNFFQESGRPNRHAAHDVGQATALLTVQATSLGLFVHQMAGFRTAQAREVLSIPEGYDPLTMIVLGYYGDASTLPEELRGRELAERRRRPSAEFLFRGRWGTPLIEG